MQCSGCFEMCQFIYNLITYMEYSITECFLSLPELSSLGTVQWTQSDWIM